MVRSALGGRRSHAGAISLSIPSAQSTSDVLEFLRSEGVKYAVSIDSTIAPPTATRSPAPSDWLKTIPPD